MSCNLVPKWKTLITYIEALQNWIISKPAIYKTIVFIPELYQDNLHNN